MLTILVCLKPIKGSYLSNGKEVSDELRLNPYDIPALINALEIKKANQNCEVICICMGVEGAKTVLNRCVALGADRTILLNDIKFAGSDTYATSYILVEAIKKIGNIDFVICGAKSIDGETGQVPIEMASRMGMRYMPHVRKIDSIDDNYAIVDILNDDTWEKCKVCLPFMAIFKDFEVIEPTCSLLQLKRAQKNPPQKWGLEDLNISELEVGQTGAKTRVVSVIKAKRNSKAHYVMGSIEEKSIYLHSLLTENSYYSL